MGLNIPIDQQILVGGDAVAALRKLSSCLLDYYLDDIAGIIDAFKRLVDMSESFIGALNDYDDSFISTSTKKKPKYRQYPYQMNYIQPQVKILKNLPYQMRVY